MRLRKALGLLLVLLVAAARSQSAPPSIERIGLTLLTSPEIRKELKLSKEVSVQVEAEFKAYVEKAQSLFRGKTTQAEQQAALTELRKVQDATAARILGKLTPSQRLRLRQLTLQSQSVLLILHPEVVKELRERTGIGMMECKRALEETSGDAEKAVELLREVMTTETPGAMWWA